MTIKIRSGWDRNSINAVEVLKLAEDCGVEGLTIHGRTRSDLFGGHADWGIIGKVKQQASIPIIGNGDVFSPADVKKMFEETGVDGVMMGRGVLSNPWLMQQSWNYICGKPAIKISLKQKADFMSQFLRRVCNEVPQPVALGKMKKIGGCLSKGFPQGAHLRARIHSASTVGEFFETMDAYINREIDNVSS